MMNMIAKGDTLVVAAPYDRTSGQGAKVGSIFGVAVHDALVGLDLSIALTGIFELTKAGTQAWTVGAKIYWDDGAKVCTTAAGAGANLLIGVAVEAVGAGAGETLGKVLLTRAFTI